MCQHKLRSGGYRTAFGRLAQHVRAFVFLSHSCDSQNATLCCLNLLPHWWLPQVFATHKRSLPMRIARYRIDVDCEIKPRHRDGGYQRFTSLMTRQAAFGKGWRSQ